MRPRNQRREIPNDNTKTHFHSTGPGILAVLQFEIDMPRTLLLSEIFPPTHGGSGRWFWEIYRRFSQDRLTCLVGEHSEQAAFDVTHTMDVVRTNLSQKEWGFIRPTGWKQYLGNLKKIRRIVRDRGIDRIQCGRCLPEGWLAWLAKHTIGVPYECYVHGEDVETAACSRELRWMVRRVLASADRLIANSRNTASLLEGQWQIPSDRITVLHPGVDTQRFHPVEHSDVARQKLGWRHRTVILTVGRLQRRKGQDMMIQALPIIRDAIPNVLYAIVGDAGLSLRGRVRRAFVFSARLDDPHAGEARGAGRGFCGGAGVRRREGGLRLPQRTERARLLPG